MRVGQVMIYFDPKQRRLLALKVCEVQHNVDETGVPAQLGVSAAFAFVLKESEGREVPSHFGSSRLRTKELASMSSSSGSVNPRI